MDVKSVFAYKVGTLMTKVKVMVGLLILSWVDDAPLCTMILCNMLYFAFSTSDKMSVIVKILGPHMSADFKG